jgi:putative membrane protein
MHLIWQIYKTDWINIFKVPTGIFLIIAIIILPCLYDWVNIESVWDPYAHTEGIKVAVTSEDQGATVVGKNINIGNKLLTSLKTNKKLGWTFVDKEKAERGVNRGVYYASILIPSDFSSRITGIIDGKLDRPVVIYSVNEKVNAIAPKITSSGISTITKEINDSFTEAVSEALLTKLTEVGIQIEEQLPAIRKVEKGFFALESMLPEIQAAGQKILKIEKKLPEIHNKAQIITEVEKKIPEINQAAHYVLAIGQKWPIINDAISEILVIQSKLPEIQQAAARIQELDQNFDKVVNTVALASNKTSKAIGILTAAQAEMSRMANIAEKGTAFANPLAEFIAANDEAFRTITPVIKQNLMLVQHAVDSTELLTERLISMKPDDLPTTEEVNTVRDRISAVGRALLHTLSLLSRINSYIPSQPLNDEIEQLQTLKSNLNRQIQILGTIAITLENGKSLAKDTGERLNELSKATNAVIGTILSKYDSVIVPEITQGMEQLITLVGESSDKLQTAKERLPDIAAILEDTKAGLNFRQAELTKIEGEMPQIRTRIHELAQALQSKTDAFAGAINIAAPIVRDHLPEIGKKLEEAALFINNDLPQAEKELSKLADFVRYKLPEVESGVHKVAGLVRNDLPQLEKAVRQAANKLREVEENNHFAELAKLLRGDIKQESEFLASPVEIMENRTYPIPNYGSAMSPFYCVLSLWVGATLLISLLKAEADNPEGRFKAYQLFLGRLATFVTIGLLQALCITLGDFFILNAYVVDKIPFVLFAMLISVVFVTITYTLLSVFGNVGKGIAIIFMVFQFSSSGGTFPISMTSPFFQALYPFMPFTYAISLLREGVGGILWETALRDILYLFGFIGLSLFIALVLKRPLSGIIKKSTDNAKKTKIIA